ncbi:histone deacetylase family protein [Piscinibacter sp. HJYY11]|uniref:histone deacetylase family protein n=1 Tax=Piscinibacter sp. HJYY11 TaxID=2801333 RepID=UPI00191EF97F|nr:histone deacetylase family protein [Piscinibacter sp. HJYY11]MBL0729650.1 histone deacetylase family protein [Piscinibacter sp. HJYY11]
MLTVFSTNHRLHHGVELKDGAIKLSFEEPLRADTVLDRVRSAGLGDVTAEHAYERSCYVAAHSERYVRFLETAWDQWSATGRSHDALPLVWPVNGLPSDEEPDHIDGKLGFFAMDAGAPIGVHTWHAVSSSANVALTGIDAVLNGATSAFALCRPPGHHAAREYAGGYCYLNNAAIAAERCVSRGARRVAILDVDFHHGNGTQDIFYQRADVLFASIHGDPKVSYPFFAGSSDELGSGPGYGFTVNYPMPWGTDWNHYQIALDSAIDRIARHRPDVLIVSLGVDTFKDDPISHFQLTTDDYLLMGKRIARARVPTLFVMEGGYMVDEIGLNAVNVLLGFEADV